MGYALLCLTLLMNVNRFGKCHVSREIIDILCGWLAFVGAIVTIYIATDEWRASTYVLVMVID